MPFKGPFCCPFFCYLKRSRRGRFCYVVSRITAGCLDHYGDKCHDNARVDKTHCCLIRTPVRIVYGNFLKISRQMESVKVFSTWRHLSLFFLKWFLLLFSAAEMSSFSCLAFYGLCCRRGRWKDGLNTSCSPAIQIMDQLSIKRAPKKPLELNA